MSINPELLEILACPKCKGDLRVAAQEDGLLCESCGVVYPVVDGVPIMLEEEAIPQAEWKGSDFPEKSKA